MKRAVLLTVLLFAAAAPAWAYVPPAERMLELWAEAYDKAPELQLTGTLEQGAAKVAFTVHLGASGIVFEEAGRPVSDVTHNLVFTTLLAPKAALTWLRGLGLDTAKTGLARSGTRIAWTLGALGESQPGTQLWLDRDLHIPLQARIVRPTLTQTIEFLDYDKSTSKIVPHVIRVTVDGVVRTYAIEQVTKR